MGKKKRLISRAECRRRMLEGIEGKTRVADSALEAVEEAADHELACILLENIGTKDKTIKARL